jgi:hypothetical protein
MSGQASPQRFRDDGRSLLNYLDDILVTCPKCGGAARVRLAEPPAPPPKRPVIAGFAPRHLVCSSCTFRSVWNGKTIALNRLAGGAARDPYFGLPLRLQVPTRHGMLFAHNADHLAWIEAFVAAGLRERCAGGKPSSRSIASRLPRWVKSAKNRDEVVRALLRLRRLADAPVR